MYNIGYDADLNGTFFGVAILMAFLNCTINPFIDLIKYKDYQQALKHCFNYIKRVDENEEVKCSTDSTSKMSPNINT